MNTGLFLVPLFLLLSLAGCLQEPPEPAIEAGKATYRLNGSERTMTAELRAPVQIRTSRDAFLDAYPLEVVNGKERSTYFLDGSFRVVRQDFPCLGRDCVYLDWGLAYNPLPLGFSLLSQIQSTGGLAFADMASTWITLQPTLKEDGSAVRIEIGDDEAAGIKGLAGTFEFRDTAIFPTRVVQSGNGSGEEWVRTSYEAGGSLPPIPEWSTALTPTPGPPRQMFPGDSEPLPGFGLVPAEALGMLLSRRAEARDLLEAGGCIVGFEAMHVHEEGQGVLVNQIKPEVIVTIEIAQDADLAKAWTIIWGTNLLGDKQYDEPQGPRTGKPSKIPGGCDAVRRSPPPSLSATDFLSAAAKLTIDSPGPPDFVFHVVEFSRRDPPPEHGWARYALTYYPPGSDPTASGTFFPFVQTSSANGQGWVFMQVPSKNAASIDGG